MTFSDAAEQQRRKEAKALKRCLTYSLAGSLLIHGGAFLLKLNLAKNSEEPISEEIAIVVMEPIASQTETEPKITSLRGSSAAGGGSSNENSQPASELLAPSDPALLETPAALSMSPEESLLQEPSASPERPLAQDNPPAVQKPAQPGEALSPTPVPSLSPSAESPSEEEESIENALVGDTRNTQVKSAPAPLTNLETWRNWLEGLRRNREMPRSAGSETHSSGSPSGDRSTDGESENSGNGNSVAAGIGTGSSQDSDASGSGIGNGSGVDQGTSRGTGTGLNGEGSGESLDEAGASRQIACRSCPKPEYPSAALQSGAEGRVRVSVEVDENGRVIGASLVGSSGNAALDQAVLETVREQYEFEGVGNGGATIPIEVDMTLEGSDFNRRARERGDRTSIETQDSAPVATPAPEPIESTATEPAVAPTEPLPALYPAIAEPTPSISPSEPVLEETPAANPEPVTPVEPDLSYSESHSEPLPPEASSRPEPLAEPDLIPASSSPESIDLPPSVPVAIPPESPTSSTPE